MFCVSLLKSPFISRQRSLIFSTRVLLVHCGFDANITNYLRFLLFYRFRLCFNFCSNCSLLAHRNSSELRMSTSWAVTLPNPLLGPSSVLELSQHFPNTQSHPLPRPCRFFLSKAKHFSLLTTPKLSGAARAALRAKGQAGRLALARTGSGMRPDVHY